MTPEFIQLRHELSKSNTHETSMLRGCIADLIRDKADRNLLNICLNAGVLQDFFQEITHDTFFISRCERRLIEEFFINETAAERAISYCKFLTQKEIELIPYRKGDKWGYCDKNKKMVVACKYDGAWIFIDGLARVRLNGKYGFIDKTGKEIVPFNYYSACNFDKGFVKIYPHLGSGWIILNKTGKIMPHLKSLNFHECLAAVCRSGEWGFIDLSGKEVIPYKYLQVLPFNEGLAGFNYSYNKWGFIDKADNVVIAQKYEKVFSFSEGIARVQQGGKLGLIDKDGHEIVKCIYDDILPFSEGMAGVKREKKWGFIDIIGNEIIPFKYDDLLTFKDGAAGIYHDLQESYCDESNYYDESKQEYIYYDHQDLIDYTEGNTSVFKDCELHFEKSFSQIYLGIDQYYIFSKYDNVLTFKQGVARVPVNEKWSLIDKLGNEIVPHQYDEIRYYCEGMAGVKLNNKYGFINNTGKEIVACKYDGVSDFKEGIAWVNLNGKYNYIDLNGKELMTFKYDKAYYFNEGIGIFKIGVTYGCVDKSGNEIMLYNYDRVSYFKDGVSLVRKDGKEGLIDKWNEIVPCKYVSMIRFINEDILYVWIPDKGHGGFIDKSGTEYWEE